MSELTTKELAARIELYLATADTVREAAEKKAEEVRDFWVSIAPTFGDRDPKENKPPSELDGRVANAYAGEYRNSIMIYSSRKGVSVGSKTLIAELLEYPGTHSPGYACAAQTVAHFGGDSNERLMNQRKSVGGIDIVEE